MFKSLMVPARVRWITAGVAWAAPAIFVLLGVLMVMPPSPKDASAPAQVFSAARAMTHLERIARQPRPTGSPFAAEVRAYLVAELTRLGFRTEVQDTFGYREKEPTHFHGAQVRNVLGRLEGTGDGQAIMLVAHYDSVGAGPGANDDGVAVAALLEAARALTTDGPRRNDVIVLFSDAEEFDLIGSHAFMDKHPWARDVGLALNFEARGNSGPSVMFQSSGANSDLIAALDASGAPVGNSLGQAIYAIMPHYTDFDVVSGAGVRGMNFAYVGGLMYYHTTIDSLENVNPTSLQHHGEYALGITRYFIDRDLTGAQAIDVVYFNLPGIGLVAYPRSLTAPLGGFALLLAAAVVVMGVRRRLLSVRRLLLATPLVLAGVVLGGAAPWAAWEAVRALYPGYERIPNGDVYNSGLYLAAFGAVAVTVVAWWLRRAQRWVGRENLAAGAMLWWSILLVVVLLVLPEAGYLFTWPLIAGAGAALHLTVRRAATSPLRRVVCCLPAAAVGILLFAPVAYLSFLIAGPKYAGAVFALVTSLVVLAVPYLREVVPVGARRIPRISAGAAAVLLAVAVTTGGFTADKPVPNNFFYLLDADTGQARWGTLDEPPMAWTEKFAHAHDEDRLLPEFFRKSYPFRLGPAPSANLPGPEVEVLSNMVNQDVRTVRLNVRSVRNAPILEIVSQSPAVVSSAVVNGTRLANTHDRDPDGYRWSLHFIAPPKEGLELTLEIRSAEPFDLRVFDRSFSVMEIPELKGLVQRPEGTMPGNDDGDFVATSRGVTIT
ncbi:M20/M25/M40 family metallo-hydrolase [Nonomuraea antimicrobica]|uniref:M20/M25/M40 family metallo-hydrolase n=1 Tax=Nonomuraea antimicrobica TaxID=561173 RepID=A0ABP7DSX8_9ACTN